MNIKVTDLKTKLAKLAEQIVDKEAAEYYANEIVEAHIRKSPRTNVLKSAVADVEKSIEMKGVKISYDVDLPSYFSINFHGHGPLTYIKQIHDELEERANKNGLAMAAFINGQSMHTLHTWVQGLAKRGLLGLAVCNGGPSSVIPFNGTRGLFGTNPMAYGIPGDDGEIYCVDMATSEIPFFEFMNSLKNSEPLKERSAVDEEGEFTTNAKNAVVEGSDPSDPVTRIVPMGGGYRGYYVVYLMEVLTSALIGSPSSPEMSTNFVAQEHGAILIAFSPKAFGTVDSFKKSIKALHQSIKSQPSKEGTEIRLPGESNNLKYSNTSEEVEVDEKTLEKLI